MWFKVKDVSYSSWLVRIEPTFVLETLITVAPYVTNPDKKLASVRITYHFS